jgi:hypothetical protein
MSATFQSFWVRKLIGKLGVPYNRRLRVRGSPHPLDYDADLSFPAAESNAFRIQSDLPCFEHRIAALSCFASGGVTRTANTSPLAFCVPIRAFMEDLAGRLSRRVQLSSDALNAYPEAVESGFGSEVDYGQLVKTYGVVNLNKDAASRYSPAEVVKTERTVISGMPDVSHITTSHVEKQNHTLRMHCRRLTRLTNAFSKKFENFQAAVALNFAYYNFCKTHKSLRMTPAQAAGIESSAWTVEELVKRCGE